MHYYNWLLSNITWYLRYKFLNLYFFAFWKGLNINDSVNLIQFSDDNNHLPTEIIVIDFPKIAQANNIITSTIF